MIELDNQPSITLRALRGFFANCKEVRRFVESRAEAKALSPAEEVKLKRDALSKTKTHFTGNIDFHNGLTMSVETEIQLETMEVTGFLFKWEDYENRQHRQRVCVRARPSNLGLPEPVYYFVCPHSGRICRKLFFDGYSLASRYAFAHTYSKRNRSHNWRRFDQLLSATLYVEEAGAYRKERYRGKLTPHGKKMLRALRYYQDGSDRIRDSFNDRGRPRKR